MKAKCVTIGDEQEEFLLNQKKPFNLSKFVRFSLDNYIKLRKEYKEFIMEAK